MDGFRETAGHMMDFNKDKRESLKRLLKGSAAAWLA